MVYFPAAASCFGLVWRVLTHKVLGNDVAVGSMLPARCPLPIEPFKVPKTCVVYDDHNLNYKDLPTKSLFYKRHDADSF